MKIIISTIFILSALMLTVLINPITNLDNIPNIEKISLNNSKIINVCDYSLNDIYPVMSDTIKIGDIDNYICSNDLELVETPAEFSWKNYKNFDFTTPARNQDGCGSCWAFGALGVIESLINIKENIDIDIDLSEQYLLSCLPASGSCHGGTSASPFSYIMNVSEDGNFCNGVIFEDCLPYEADDSIPCSEKASYWKDTLVPISDYGEAWLGEYNPSNIDLIKSKVFENGPVYTLMFVDDLFRSFGSISHKSTSYFPYRNIHDLILNHAIVIVGWRDDDSIRNGGYWICKNSWDTDWGYNGFFNIEYGAQLIGYYIAWVDYDPDSFNCPPVPNAGGYRQSSVNEEIIFDASSSIDDEGDIVSYIWDFGDGSIVEGVNSSHVFSNPGFYKVTLTIFDNDNKSSTDTTLVAIDEELNIVDFRGGSSLTITISNPSDFDLVDCSLSIIISGGFQNMDYRYEIIEMISSNSDYSLILPLVGLGRGTIKIIFEDIEFSEDYFILGPYVCFK